MLSKKVIATAITNLTDARYFAARGIDYLLFDLDAIDLIQRSRKLAYPAEGFFEQLQYWGALDYQFFGY